MRDVDLYTSSKKLWQQHQIKVCSEFKGGGPRCHLHLVIDDATSKIYSGFFCLEETTEGYFKTLILLGFVALKKNSYQETKTIGQKSLMVKKSSKTNDQKMRKGIISILR